MLRRTAIKNISIAAGGIISLPHWMMSCGLSDKGTHNTTFNESQQKTLAAVADTIIPAGNAIGALSVEVDKFLQKLVDDCYEKPVQDNIKKQLDALAATAQSSYKMPFNSCTQEQRETMLLKLAGSAVKEEKEFFDLLKTETIRGFNTSQQVMEQYHDYKVAPGHYYGCVPIQVSTNG